MPRYSAIFLREEDDPQIVRSIFELRTRIFIEQRGWALQQTDGLEIDEFDRPDVEYCALFASGQLIGSFRALRTDRPYLARTVFPKLAETRPFPEDENVYEITRFGIDCNHADHRDAMRLYGLMFWFALRRDATSLVAVCDRTYERFLATLGIRTIRYGAPCTIGTDASGAPIEGLAGEIPIRLQAGQRFSRLLATTDTMEIIDEASILGRRRLSA